MELKFYPERKIGSEVDLSHVKTEYATDNVIREWQKGKEEEIEYFSVWYEKNKEVIDGRKDSIIAAVADGIIENAEPETIWNFRKRMFADIGEHIIVLRDSIKEKQDEILDRIAMRLAVYLPDWKPENVTILFTCYDEANFCIENSRITVDLVRLSIGLASFEQIEDGLVHELVHEWMKDPQADKYTNKDRIMRGLVGEGIATHIAKQDLKKHHEKNGTNYEDFRKKSFELFEKFLNCSENDDFAAFKDVFLNMGEFYVVGNEIAKVVESKMGPEKFRDFLLEIRKNPNVLLDKYNQLKDL